MSNKYVLDANPFIEAKNRYYGFDICPGFWTSLITQHNAKRVFSIDRIRDELAEQDDEIKDWIDNRVPDTFFKKTADQAVVDKFQETSRLLYQRATPGVRRVEGSLGEHPERIQPEPV